MCGVITIFVIAVVVGIQGIHLDMGTTDNICERTITRIISHLVYVNKKKVRCNEDLTHCTVTYSIEAETRYRTETTTVHECCEGFVEVDGVCTKDETSTVKGTDRQTRESSSQISTPMLIGIGSVIVIIILVTVAVIAICIIKRKPKLYYLMKRIRKGSQTDEGHYSEAMDYSSGYMEPIKTGVVPNIGNALYKRETIGIQREQNAYTDLRFQNGKYQDDYTKLNEQISPPVHKITQFFENKNNDQSSDKASVHNNKRTNTVPAKKTPIQKEARSNSTPNIKIARKVEKNLDQNTLSENSRLANGNSVTALLRKMESISQNEVDNSGQSTSNMSSTLPKPQKKALSLVSLPNKSSTQGGGTFQRGNPKPRKQNTMPRIKTGSSQTANKPVLSCKPKITQNTKPIKTSQYRMESAITTKKESQNINQQWQGQSRNMKTKTSEEPPAYDDVHFYDYVK